MSGYRHGVPNEDQRNQNLVHHRYDVVYEVAGVVQVTVFDSLPTTRQPPRHYYTLPKLELAQNASLLVIAEEQGRNDRHKQRSRHVQQ